MRPRIPLDHRSEIAQYMHEEVDQHALGNLEYLSTNARLAQKYGLHRNSIKDISFMLPEATRQYRLRQLRRQTRVGHHNGSDESMRAFLALELANEKYQNPQYLERLVDKVAKKYERFKRYSVDIKRYSVDIFERNAFMLLVGMYQEAHRVMRDCFDIVYHSPQDGDVLRQMFVDAFDELPFEHSYPNQHFPNRMRMQFFSVHVMQVIARLTSNNKHPPYGIIDFPLRRLSYLRGFLYRGGRVSCKKVKGTDVTSHRPRIVVHASRKTPRFLSGLQGLLAEQHILTTQSQRGLCVYDLKSMQRIASLELLAQSQHELLCEVLVELGCTLSKPVARNTAYPSCPSYE